MMGKAEGDGEKEDSNKDENITGYILPLTIVVQGAVFYFSVNQQ